MESYLNDNDLFDRTRDISVDILNKPSISHLWSDESITRGLPQSFPEIQLQNDSSYTYSPSITNSLSSSWSDAGLLYGMKENDLVYRDLPASYLGSGLSEFNDSNSRSPKLYQYKTNTIDKPIEDNIDVIRIECHVDKVKSLIGLKGIVIKTIMRKTRTTITVDQQFDDQNRSIEIKGKSENVQSAIILVQGVLDNGPSYIDTYSQSPIKSTEIGRYRSEDSDIDSPLVKGKSISDVLVYEFYCPSDKISIVIGAKGVIIKEISKRSNAQISIAEESKPYHAIPTNAYVIDISDNKPNSLRRIELRGQNNEIELAKALILSVVHDGPNALYSISKNELSESLLRSSSVITSKITTEVPCPKEKVGAIIGSKGSVVRELIKATGTQISVADDVVNYQASKVPYVSANSSNGLVEVRVVTIRGYAEDVSKAVTMIEDIIKLSYKSDSNDNPSGSYDSYDLTDSLLCPIDKVGEIIGWRGSVIKNLSVQSGAKIVLSDCIESTSNKLIEIKGTNEQVHSAKKLIQEILTNSTIKKDKSSVDNNLGTLHIPEEYIYIIKKSYMTTIRDIMNDTNTSITLDTNQINIYTDNVEQSSHAINKLKNLLNKLTVDKEVSKEIAREIKESSKEQIIKENKHIIYEFIDCPIDKCYLFIGIKGNNLLKDITTKTKTTISLVKNTNNNLTVESTNNIETKKMMISGLVDDVDKAKALIVKLISDSPNNQSNPTNKTKILKKNELLHNEEDRNNDIEIYDNALDHSEKVTDKLADVENDIDDSIVNFTIECPNEKVGLIIGSKGIVIKSMMNRSKAKIIVTSETVNGKTIRRVEITGTESQVQSAKEMVECVIKYGNEALDQSSDASLGLGIITKLIEIPSDCIKNIVGPKGTTMRKIYQDSLASITIAKAVNDNSSTRQVAVKGTITEVERAVSMIDKLIKNIPLDEITHYNDNDNDLDFEDDLTNSPKRLSRSDSLTSPTKSPLNDTNESPNNDERSFTPQRGILKVSSPGKRKASPAVYKNLKCPLSKVGSLIGTRGTIIKEVMKRTGTTIIIGDCPDPGSNQDYRDVSIRGPQNSVEVAEKLVLDIIEYGTKILLNSKSNSNDFIEYIDDNSI